MSVSSQLAWSAALCVALVLGGLGWLLFRRCKFTIPQLIIAGVLYGAMMRLSMLRDSDAIVMYAICNGMAVAVGLFLGARNARVTDAKNRSMALALFIAGLVAPYSVIGGAVSLVMVLAKDSLTQILGWTWMAASAVSLIATVTCVIFEKDGAGTSMEGR